MLRFTAIFVALLGLTAANWELYKTVYGKSYSHEEDRFRRNLFTKKVAMISAHNLRHDLGLSSYRLGLNRFADLTEDELKRTKGLKFNASNVVRTGVRFAHEEIIGQLPRSIDLRTKGYVTPVKDQGDCGSCWAFSATGSLEGQHFRKTGKLVSLSEQNLVDCAKGGDNDGCNGGLVDEAFAYIKDNGGVDTEASYPYKGVDEKCAFKPNAVGAKVTGFFDIDPGSEKALQTAVAAFGPVSVAIDANSDEFHQYKEGIFNNPDCSSVELHHAVLVVGYGVEEGQDYWIVKNSWGLDWGEKGYIRMSRNKKNQCGIANHASFPLVFPQKLRSSLES